MPPKLNNIASVRNPWQIMSTPKQKIAEFYPPRLNRIFVRLLQTIAPPLVRWRFQLDVEISQDCLEKLENLPDQRLLLLPNHSNFDDPASMFLLSARLGQAFNYLAAFEGFKGLQGCFLQQAGVYSIRRGVADRASIAQTLELLTQPKCRLVIFPEGGCSFQNDTVMPFRVGAVQIALQAIAKLVKRGSTPPDLYLVPISIKYRYTQDMNPAIDAILNRLEQALQVKKASSLYERLRVVAEQVLVNCEQEYGVYTPENAQEPWNQRISNLKAFVLHSCEEKLAISSSPNELNRERVYKIEYVLQSKAETLVADDFWNASSIQKAAMRLLNFDAIYDGYVAAAPTPERFLDTLTRLEREVFDIDQPPPKGHKIAAIWIGDPVNLKDYFQDYQEDRSGTVNYLVENVQQAVQSNLDRLMPFSSFIATQLPNKDDRGGQASSPNMASKK